MALNISKSKAIFISSSQKQLFINEPHKTIVVGNESIPLASEVKLLGVTINSTLTWDKHIEITLKTCNSYLYLLSRIKQFLNINLRKLFYNSYILPHLDYCCVIWGNASEYLIDKVVKFQKRAARIILDKDLDHPSEELFIRLKWMKFPDRVIYQKAIFMYKIMNNTCPDYFTSYFTYTSDVHTKGLRSSSSAKLYIPKPNSELFRNAFFYSGACIWNTIPEYVKCATTLSNFKARYLKSVQFK
jgi:hypothetical protein